MRNVILKVFLIVGIDNEITYSECTQNVSKFSYNILHAVFFSLSLNIKFLCTLTSEIVRTVLVSAIKNH